MIVAFSTTSPLSSVALLGPDGSIVAADEQMAPRAAGGACLTMLEKLMKVSGRDLADANLFVADVGPGSFTGVRVCVMLAKSFGFSLGKKVAGVTAFDLISLSEPVAISAKQNEYHQKIPGAAPEYVSALTAGFIGYGPGLKEQVFPKASRVSAVIDKLEPVAPENLMPLYLADPSVSTPKKPFRVASGADLGQ